MKRIKIMTVEDNALFAKIIEFNLSEKLNLVVKNCMSGEECLSNLNWNPNLIILDYALPGINGIDTLKGIKKQNENIKVIVLSSQFEKHISDEFIAEGALVFIEKNNNPVDKLTKFIEEVMLSVGN